MPPANRQNPVRANSSESRISFMEFMREFPDDAACLDYLWRTRYAEDGENAECPKCEKVRPFKRYETKQRRQSWTCTGCGHHIHPTAGTIFEKSSTSLQLWFYAIYLVSSSKCGIAAKQLERELGGNYVLDRSGVYKFRRVRHSQRVYVEGDVHTNTVEGFFGGFKTDVRGTHHAISTRWLPGYLNHWVWMWNHRNDDRAMFRSLLD